MTTIAPPIYLNQNANINVEFNGAISLNTGDDTAPGSEFQFTADGQILINGTPLDTGGAAASPNGVTRLANGNITLQTGTDASPGPLFTFTVDGKLLKDGVDMFASTSTAPGAWITPVLLNGWKNAPTTGSFAQEPVKYRLNGNKLEFAGMADGTAAPAASQTNIMFRLPTSISSRLSYQKGIQVALNTAYTGMVKVFPDGTVCFVQGAVANSAGGGTLMLASAGSVATLNLGGTYCYLDS
jgi:hypothetical protein